MASTRDKNEPGNFYLQSYSKKKYYEYLFDPVFAYPSALALPGNGFGGARIDAALLNSEAIDVESKLRGIGANNHIFPSTPMMAQDNQGIHQYIFNRDPTISISLTGEGAQRPRLIR